MFNQLMLWVYEKTPAFWEIVGFVVFGAFVIFLVGVK
jgi:hypothetical protein